MRLELLFGLFVLIEVVLIIANLFRNKEDERRGGTRPTSRTQSPPPPIRSRAGQERPDFLEEFNRRRLEALRRREVTARPAPPPPAPVRRPQEPERRPLPLPEPAARPETARPPALAMPKEALADLIVARSLSPIGKVVVPLGGGSTSAVIKADVAGLKSPPAVQFASRDSLSAETRALLLPLLRSRAALPAAVLLSEILGPPLSRRRGRRR